jgi:hypothetical protein
MSKSGNCDAPPLLWGEWRCTANPRLWIADCVVCDGDVWIHRNGENDWRVACENGCPRDAMDAGAEVLTDAQRRRHEYQAELQATMEPDDPFYSMEATRYIEALTGHEATHGRMFRCPFHADGQERTPSLHATDLIPARWYCHGCQRGGTIYDFAALLWGIEPRREGFALIHSRLADTLLAGSSSATLHGPDGNPL